ncbi:MAG: carboxypeptidase-like regulatory domain-containing protein, partial [Cruoricaptor ignavus]|nr:carboxypeptidase-like regulatory domain-containing protein [Cruoricaptor ignavus]
MIRFCVLVFVLLSFPAIYAQIIRGTVLNENEIGLKEVSVYVDASAIGTSTDASGRFSLNLSNLKTGNLVIKKNGYKTIIYPFSSDKLKPLKIILTKETAIEEVKLLHFSDKNYNRYINRFLNEFLGFERENVTIKNPKDITF